MHVQGENIIKRFYSIMASLSSTVLDFLWYFVFVEALIISTIIASPNAQESDRIVNLPGQPKSPEISQYSGYITVNEDHGRALFYWFFEAQSETPRKPLLLWLNGGPGCSSIGYGAASELGPLRVSKNGVGLEYNKHSWYREANLLFVESPIGVGFSYTNYTSSDLSKLNDEFVAEDAYNFLVNWLERFPQFKNHDFFISGESYAGHYVPQLAELIYDRNKLPKKYPHVTLKGFIVGNPETHDPYDFRGIMEYAWSHGVISDEEYYKSNQGCDFVNTTVGCNEALSLIFNKYQEIDIYNIYATKCLLNSTVSLPAYDESLNYGLMRRTRLTPGSHDPCYSVYTEKYFNRKDVVAAIHANLLNQHMNGSWGLCSNFVQRNYNFTVSSVLPIYQKLIKRGLRIWIYSGDADGRIPFIGTRYWVEPLKLPLRSAWRSWFLNNQVGGRIVEYKGLVVSTVRGAGHMVPFNKPSEALALIHSYLSGEPLPKS